MNPEIIGYIAGVIVIISWIPQVIKSYKTKSVNDLSILMIILVLTGISLWMIYAFIVKDGPIFASNAILAVLIIWLLYMKIRYEK
jgi:MtN3 and saliva related transmembrane protein